MNDIWYLDEGVWMVYVEELQVAEDFKSIPAMQFITAYYDNRGRQKAAQFRFFQGDDLRPGSCLLHYVSRLARLDYYKVLDLAKHLPGLTYREFYQQRSYQPELFEVLNSYEPVRKHTGKKYKSK
ncbi:hypothetical protein SPSYN_02666 [Sporotomaculum syntrophicum]|uniref:Uncharacterized protein n=1 Tax=Sporotomaculum syntrophicum TaxID=182264 RepID=A0A9D2WPI9_9FIRM|nr:hypothetical protein [Sporotomaculum syntrophicum]KAF1084262.1 hypothetical protein SPSYN_02666 [Sporotomaculum syntrophicum]